ISSTVSPCPTTALPISARMRSARSFTSLTFTRHLQSPSVDPARERSEAGTAVHARRLPAEAGQAVGKATLGAHPVEEARQRRARELVRRADRARGGLLAQRH